VEPLRGSLQFQSSRPAGFVRYRKICRTKHSAWIYLFYL